jgi:PAS domain S-box-containing protein
MGTLKNKSKSELIEEIESLKNQVQNLEGIEEERTQAASALRESDEKLRAIFDSAADGMVETDLSGNIIKVNKAVLRIYGSDSENNFIGKSALEFYAPFEKVRALKAYRKTYYESIAEESEFMALKVGGTPFPVQITSAVLRDANEKPIGFVGIIKDITERKQSENELQKSEERYRSVVENAGELIWQVDTEGKFVFFNNYAEKLSGQKSDDSQGKHFAPLVHPDDLTHVNKIFEDTLAGKTIEYETRIFNKDGEITNLEIQTMPVYVEGEVTGTLNFGRDITERKRGEDALKESEEKYKELFEAESDALFLIENETGNIIESNLAAEKLYGYTKKELAKKKNSDLSVESEKTQKITKQTSPNKEDVVFIPLRYHKKSDGTVFPVEITGRFFNWKGKSVHIAAIRDITERKQAEEALKGSEEKFRRLAENAPDIIYRFRVSPDPGFEYISPAVTEIAGYTPQEFYDDPELGPNIIHPDDRSKLSGIYKGIIPEDPHQVRWIRKDGKIIWTEDRAIPIYNEKGEFIAIEGIAREITAQKEAEEALREAYDIINKSPAIPFLWQNEEDWPVEYVSENVVDLFEYTAEEFMSGKVNYSKLIYPEDLERVGNEVTRYASEKGADRFSHEPYRIVTKSGKVKWIEDKTYIRRDDKNNITHYQGIVEDITTRRISELARLESEERVTKIFNSSPNPMIISEIESGKIIDMNNSFEKLIIYSKQEIIGKRVVELNLWENSKDRENYINKIKEDKRVYNLEIKIRTKSGDIRDSLISGEILTIQGKSYLLTSGIDITERKLTEEALRKSENKFRNVLENIQLIGLMLDENGRLTFANDYLLKLTGWKREEVIGKDWFENFLPGNVRDNVKKMFYETINSGVFPRSYQNEIITKEGELKIIGWSNSAHFDNNNNTYVVTSIGEDITERKQAEESLRESEQKFREMADLLPQIVYETDLNANLTFSNKKASLIFGYSEKDLMSNFNVLDNVIPEDRDRARENMKKIMNGKPVSNSEYTLIKKDGSTFPVLIYSSRVLKDGKPAGLRGIVVDISERKHAEELIRESERRLATLMSNLPGMAYRCRNDSNWTMEFISDGGYSLTGYHAEDLVNSAAVSYAELIHPEDRQMVWDDVQEALEKKQPFQLTYRISTAGGEEKWVWEKGQAIYGTENDVISLEGFITDITEGKKAEKKLRDSHNQLRSLAERLQMIREEERATVAREIHDDLGQTLTALKMDIAWMKKNSGMTEEMRASKMDVMLRLTDSTIQTVKRIATDLRPGILDDLGLVSAIEWQTKEFQNRSGIECNFEIFVDEFTVEDDISIAVFRIFQESLTNIARHSQATKVTVTIMREDDFLLVEISDNGVGISEEQISSSKSLGLIGMNERVSVFRGKLKISNEANGGTTVRVYIPIGKS